MGTRRDEDRWHRRRALFWSTKEEYPVTHQSREMSYEDRQAYNAYMRVKNREYWLAFRNEILEKLGGKCAICGFSDRRALQIDHINGGGTREMIEKSRSSYAHYKNVIASIAAGENKYQLLCANCNWIKRYENNEDATSTGRSYAKKHLPEIEDL